MTAVKKSPRAATRTASKPLVGVIGLGIMGGTMAEELLRQGYPVCGHDIDAKARARLKKAGGQVMADNTAVAAHAEVVIVSVATAKALADVSQAIAAAPRKRGRKPQVVVETSTLTLDDKNQSEQLLRRAGRMVLDCPISGTAVRLKERAWTIYASGERAAYDQVLGILHAFTDQVPYLGDYGNGTKMKFAANHLVAIYNVAYAESVTLARKMGLDPAQMLELFGHSPVLGTGVMRLRMAMMVRQQYTPPTMKVEVWQKDMEVIGQMAKSVDCPTPLFTASASIYTAAMAQGLGASDTASTAEVLGAMAGLPAAGKKRKRQAALRRLSRQRTPGVGD